jgi:hypothetical protein
MTIGDGEKWWWWWWCGAWRLRTPLVKDKGFVSWIRAGVSVYASGDFGVGVFVLLLLVGVVVVVVMSMAQTFKC